jgi:hypothetical protein
LAHLRKDGGGGCHARGLQIRGGEVGYRTQRRAQRGEEVATEELAGSAEEERIGAGKRSSSRGGSARRERGHGSGCMADDAGGGSGAGRDWRRGAAAQACGGGSGSQLHRVVANKAA